MTSNLLISLLLLVLILIRQLSARVVLHQTRTFLILIGIGCLLAYQGRSTIHWNLLLLSAIGFGDIFLPIFFGWLRAISSKIWFDSEKQLIFCKGTLITAGLWLAYIALRGMIGYLIKGSDNFMLISLGLSLLTQRELIWQRVSRLFPREISKNQAFQLKHDKKDK